MISFAYNVLPQQQEREREREREREGEGEGEREEISTKTLQQLKENSAFVNTLSVHAEKHCKDGSK
jgi:hypothetical protein